MILTVSFVREGPRNVLNCYWEFLQRSAYLPHQRSTGDKLSMRSTGPLTQLRFGTLLPETIYFKCLILVICVSLPIWRELFLFGWESANPWRNAGLVALNFRANRVPRTISLKMGRAGRRLTYKSDEQNSANSFVAYWDVRVFDQRLYGEAWRDQLTSNWAEFGLNARLGSTSTP